MKKKKMSYRSVLAAGAIVLALASSIAWITPPFSAEEESKTTTYAAGTGTVNAAGAMNATSEEGRLIQQLEGDGLINQVKGFVVEKKRDQLFINGAQMSASVAGKYISTLTKDQIRVEVHPFIERLREHPDAGFMQVLLPVLMESPCVKSKPKNDGC